MSRSGPMLSVLHWLKAFELGVEVAWKNPSTTVSVRGGWRNIPLETRRACETSPFRGWSQTEAGFNIVESLRAQGFLKRMALRGEVLERGVDPSLLASLREAEGNYNTLRAQWLAIGLTAAVRLLDPDTLVLGGGAILGCPGYRALTLESLHNTCPPAYLQGCTIHPPHLGPWSGSVGAALLAGRGL